MTIAHIELRQCRAGWRKYHFVKLTTADGVVGWSEFDEGYDAVGVSTAIRHLAPHVLGEDVMAHERIHARLCGVARQSLTGVLVRAIGAIENAVLDAKARTLNVPCHALFGGKVRDRVRVYWSHCGTWRISRPDHYPPAVRTLDDVRALGAEVRARGFTALKTNIFRPTPHGLRGWAPGFARAGDMERTPPRAVLTGLRDYLQALRDGAGPDMDILLDLNFNARTEGYLSFLRALADLGLYWVEIDTPSPAALATIRAASPCTISGCESLTSLVEFLPFFEREALDVAIIDAVWIGVWQSLKIAAAADAYQVNVAPHNYYGHLSTMMTAHFCAAVPNLKIMETDIDRIAADAELFTVAPTYEAGHLVVPDTPGWGTAPVEAALERYPAK
ncbi:MAG TPA: mandelate racemase/muconate lactonizing enzyme family protein [Quisquiliibacterium sp.]|nr:mandelate racemase/muconate lactonizing enzyme family protein [Quisquiliibacterium sp.]